MNTTTTTSIEKIKKGLERILIGVFTETEILQDATERYATELSKIKKLNFLVIDEETATSITYHLEIPVIEL